jgi:hypothetical protein
MGVVAEHRGRIPTFADVNQDIGRTLGPPGDLYFAWMSVLGSLLAAGILARTYQILAGMGAAGKRTPQMWAMYVAVMVVALSLTAPVEGTHAVDHRYLILGYVRDSGGRPLVRAAVRVVREKTGLAHEAETDAEGFYLVILHLHDEDVLEPFRVTVKRATLRIEARFNPLDPRTPRGTRVDFGDGVARERPEEFAATLERYVSK